MFIRFVVQKLDQDSQKQQGLFHAMNELLDDGALMDYESEHEKELHKWFKRNLKIPKSFSKSNKTHAKAVAISWFKDSAIKQIRKMHEYAQILESHDYAVMRLTTSRPGYVVYEDEHQVVAEPYNDTFR